MYRVLMPIDEGEERVRTQVNAITRLPNAAEEVSVTLFHTFDDEEEAREATLADIPTGSEAMDLLESEGIAVDEMTGAGDPATEIIAASEALGADAIVLGGRKRSKLGSMLFGSVSQAVILGAEVPVTVTGESTRTPSHRCQSCGEAYYATPETTIGTCRACGGTKVETV